MNDIMWALSQYGYIALFILLGLGIIGIPIPDETLMVFVGSLTVENGPFAFTPAFIVCLAGSLSGMFISYFVGRKIGKPLLNRYGKIFKLTPARVERAEHWFQKYGSWSIVFGYFIPGLRHLTCYMAGISRLKGSTYFIAAGTGALIWVATFLTLGHVVGNHWQSAVEWMHTKGTPLLFGFIGLAVIVGVLVYFLIRRLCARSKSTP